MPNISRSKRFSKTAKDSVFGAAIAASIVDPSKLQNAIDFIEGPGGIGIVLRPVQRVIVKAIYGVPFDYQSGHSASPDGASYQCTICSARRNSTQMSPKQSTLRSHST